MTEDQMLAFLEENKSDIQKQVKARMIDAMTKSLEWNLPNGIREAVSQFIETEVVPAVKDHLMENKGPIIDASIKAAAEIGDLVSQALVKQAVESMTGYRSGDVIKALMGVR